MSDSRPTPSINHETARTVVRLLDRAFKAEQGLLSEVSDLVERQIPEGVAVRSRQHALFLYYVVPNDHGVKSRTLYQRAKALYGERPEFFDPAWLLQADRELVADILQDSLPLRYPNNAVRGWLANTQALSERYSSDPRKLFQSSSDAREVFKNIRALFGFGPKTGGMLLRAIVGLKFAKLENVGDVLVPVDVHDTRIAFRTEMLVDPVCEQDFEGTYHRYVPIVQRLLTGACEAEGIDWLDVDRALWLIGSRGCASTRCTECPLNAHCKVGRRAAAMQAVPRLAGQVPLWPVEDNGREGTTAGSSFAK